MNVRDIMTIDAVTAPPDAGVAHLVRMMLEGHLSGVPVVDADSRLLGMVTEADMVTKHAHLHAPVYLGILGSIISFERRGNDEEIRRALAVTADELMERHVVTISPDATIEDAATVMVEENANPIPVIENHRVVGLVSRTDIIRLLLIEEEDGETPPEG